MRYFVKEFQRLGRAFGHALNGLSATLESEQSFRIEVAAAAVLVPIALYMDIPIEHSLLLVSSVLLVLLVELLNTGIEAAMDRVSPELHPLAKKAKDAGSAAVLVAIVLAALVWEVVLLGSGMSQRAPL